MTEDSEQKAKIAILKLFSSSSVARDIKEYAMQHIWDDTFKRTRYSAYFMIGVPPTVSIMLTMLRRRIHRRARFVFSVTSIFLCGFIHLDLFRKDMIQFALKDPEMFRRMTLLVDMRNLIIASEYERMQRIVESVEAEKQKLEGSRN